MVVTAMDNRSIGIVLDLVQAKAIVETLRSMIRTVDGVPFLVKASFAMQKDGFTTMADEVQAAVTSFASVVGFRTDLCKFDVKTVEQSAAEAAAQSAEQHPEPEQTPESTGESSPEGEGDGEPKPEKKKEWIN